MIATHRGLSAYTRLPFGVSSAPAIWQRTIEQILLGIPRVVVYFDDTLICGCNAQEHDQHLWEVLKRFAAAGLRLGRDKCMLRRNEVSYLGCIISEAGLKLDDSQIDAIVNAPQPSYASSPRPLLGLVNVYDRFIPNCSTMLHPLSHSLQRDIELLWSAECESAFVSMFSSPSDYCTL